MTIHFEGGEHEIQNLSLKTTVNDVIVAMLKNIVKTNNSSSQYVIVENWRRIERPLPPRTRILKVWKSWRNEQSNVKYFLKTAQRFDLFR